MTNDQSIPAQPELFKCDCCGELSTSRYSLDIQVDFVDETAKDDTGFREWVYGLCRHCYFNWLEGRMSTRDLWWACKHAWANGSERLHPD